MYGYGWLAVGGGAAAGAWLRWGLGIALNPVFPTLPLGTLASNLIAGLIMGCAMELLVQYRSMPPEVQLMVTTGFLGGLSTFSTFDAEIVSLLGHKEYLWATVHACAHLFGSIALTILGILLTRWLFSTEAL